MSNPEFELSEQSKLNQQQASHRQNALRFSLVTGILMLVVTIISTIATLNSGLLSFAGILLTLVVSAVAFGCYFVARGGRHYLASSILIITILLTSLGLPFISQGQGIQLAILTIIIVSSIASATLPSVWAWRAATASMVIGLSLVFTDLFLPDFGLPNDPVYTTVFAAILSLVYGISIYRQFPSYSIRTKLTITFIFITLIPIATLGVQATVITRQNLLDSTYTNLTENAQTTARYLDRILRNEIAKVGTEAQSLILIEYLNLVPTSRINSIEEQRAATALRSFQQENPEFLLSYAILDTNGNVVLDTSPENIGSSEASADYFQDALSSSGAVLTPVRISQASRQATFHISAAIRNGTGTIIGVLRTRYDATFIQTSILESSETPVEEEYAVLVDNETLVRLAHTGNTELLYKTYQSYPPEQVVALQQNERLLPGIEFLAVQPEVVSGIRNLASTPVFTAPADLAGSPIAYTSGFPVSNANWTVLVSRTERSALSSLDTQTRAFVILALALVALSGLLGALVSQIISRPLVELSNAASSITAGNLFSRVTVTTQDEIGLLGNTFNTMADQLRETLTSLENRVQERTQDLTNASLRAEIRARELETISQLTRAITVEQNIDTLLPLTARLVSERFGFYHTGIFLLDENRQYAVLQAANSEGGQRMLARGHKLEVGPSGIVGYVAQNGTPRIALDVGEDAIFFNNPDLPETRSEMALPLLFRGQVIGVLDVQSTEANAFNEDSINTLAILADQVTIAIENARLFSSTERALQEVQTLYTQYLRQEWQSVSQRKQARGYLQSLAGGREIHDPVVDRPLEQVLNSGKILVNNTGTRDEEMPTIAIPISLRGQVIGVLRARANNKNRTWNADEIRIAQAVSDRVALALENARLFEESQRRASKERIIGEISAKINAAANVDVILQTAVEELGRTLQGSRVAIQLDVNTNGSKEQDA